MAYLAVVPLIVFWILFRNRKRVQSQDFKRYFGSLTRSYHERFYFWELFALLKKILLVIAAEFCSTAYSSSDSKVFTVLTVLIWSHAIEQFLKPYRTRAHNRLVLL